VQLTRIPLFCALALAVGGCGGAAASMRPRSDPPPTRSAETLTVPARSRAAPAVSSGSPTTSTTTPAAASKPLTASGPFPVGERVLTLVDRSRRIRLPGGAVEPRTLVTEVWYPEHASAPFPLVIFGHGFAVTPRPYTPLLEAWARAGYIVAAPIFPLENANAPGGPDEADLVNQPRDMRFVISELLRLSARRHGFLAGAIDPREVAVSGQSDGGETALAVAYDRHFIDRRVRAAVILSGAEIPGVGGFDFPAPSPPLLATQGTADTVNLPHFTYQFFDIAPHPKFLLTMFGAQHLPPYTDQQPQLRIVERVTIAFFERYLKGWRRASGRIIRAGDVTGLSALTAEP
jgi:dienelactone hydrolase